ncbi:transcriptional regulator, lysr family [Heliomicrobium modesticaldum Ice1]|uniref:Transcriptional regulator, lysr family n=1 Tax=Heliobacterium modesticaldum (strain ATCC 51547 / Ice1) TaxID=498761 RepID=B0TI97_HELMI|nr:LysR family transcriptional regulator [Heliomicrobium modesticaldum]ABZ83517.1 transcriptional regulator, lysr family [Heliomicrobium modesticaldum Ice1]
MLDSQLAIFKTVVDKGSISLAAQELHMTQSAVSQQILNLEAHFSVKLFDRLHRRLLITTAGKTLYPFAVELEQLYGRARNAMQELTQDISGLLRIGASMTIGEYLLPKLLVLFRQTHPRVSIAMDVSNSDHITAMVATGQLDLGFIESPDQLPGVLTAFPCGGDQLVIVGPADTADSAPLSLAELFQHHWVLREPLSGTRRFFEQFLQSRGAQPADLQVVMELGSTQAIKEAVKAGLGFSVLSRFAVTEEVAQQSLAIIPLAEGPIDRTFTLFYHREKFTTLAVDSFLDFILHQVISPASPKSRAQADESPEEGQPFRENL